MLSYQFVFFILGLVCSVPFLIWYYRRQPHPRFRPKIGEMAMMSLFAILLSLGGSILIGGLMDDPGKFSPGGAFNKAQSQPDQPEPEPESEGRGSSRDRGGSKRDSGSRGSDRP